MAAFLKVVQIFLRKILIGIVNNCI